MDMDNMDSIVESINYVYKELLNRDVDETSKYIYIDKINMIFI